MRAATLALTMVVPACTPAKDAAAAARDLNASIDALEALSLGFRDSVFAARDTTTILLGSGRDPSIAGAVVDACEQPASQAPVQQHQTPAFSISLPADFEPVAPSAADERARARGLSAYEWRGEDQSTVRIASRPDTVVDGKVLGMHRGWTGAMSSECDVDINGRPAHVDIADAGGDDHVVHVHFAESELGTSGTRTIQRSLVLIAHGRSIERQRELLRAARSLQFGGG